MRLSSLDPLSFLAEGAREDFVFDRFKTKILAKLKERYPYGQFEDQDVTEIVNTLAAVDPTSTKKYLLWITKQWLGGLEAEDYYKVTQYLSVFERARSRIEIKDINLYQTVNDLYDAVAPFLNNEVSVSGKAEQDAEYSEMHSDHNIKLICNNAKFKIVIPLTKEASCYFGKNTQWCTAATGSYNYFSSYSKNGPLYIILIKSTNTRYQFHIDYNRRDRNSFMDERDHPINPSVVFSTNPGLDAAFGNRISVFLPSIGLSVLSPDVAKHEVETGGQSMLSRSILSISDFDILKKYKEITTDFAVSISYSFPKLFGELIKYMPSRTVLKMLDEYADVAGGLYEKQWTDKRKLASAVGIARRCQSEIKYQTYEGKYDFESFNMIPKPWDDSIWALYWPILANKKTLLVDDVPEKFRTEEVMSRLFYKNMTELANHPEELTPKILQSVLVLAKYAEIMYLQQVPKKYRILPEGFDNIINGYIHRGDCLDIRNMLPVDGWPASWVTDAIDHGEITKWDEIPERVRNTSSVFNALAHYQGMKSIPEHTRSRVDSGIIKKSDWESKFQTKKRQ